MAKYVFFLYTLLVSIVHIWTLGLYVEGIRDIDIVDVCHRSCETDLRYTSEGGSQLFCDQSCSVQQCNIGCQLYKEAVSSSCPKVCTSSFSRMLNTTGVTQAPSQDQMRNCIQGCIFALDKYSEEIRDKIGHLDQPLLDISTLNSSSLVLKWKTAVLESVVYKIQKKMVGMDSGWHLHDKVLFRADGRIELSSLHPYVTYKFKVLALLSSLPDHIMYSNETTEITTLPNGAPSTAPRITSLSAPSSRVISLTWLPPLFTNGKLLSYRIYVEPLNHPVLNATTIETPWNASSWLLSQLQSSLQYRISLSAWNAEGEGPKESRTIVTPSPGNLSEHETAYLILGSRNKVIKRNILDVIQHSMEYMDLVYRHDNSSILVRDLCIHVSQEMIFASDSRGMVTRISLDTKQIRSNHYPGINNAGAITVDWLSDRVYVASADRIYSCPLDQDRCVVILNGLQPSPSDLKVDPINGFLYYVISGQGLYRIDLGDIQLVTSFQSQPYRPRSQLVIDMADLWTHIIDLYNVHLYVVNNTARRMMTTFLDGSNVRLFHENVIRSEYFNVTSMIFFNQTFIWTNTTKMFGEEQESPLKDYRHNELLFFEPPFTGINVFHPSTQPTPVPSSAPDEVEALFTRVRVDIRWKPPPLLQYQGKGAWINWTYELRLISLKNGQSNVFRVSGLKHTIRNLLPNSEYSLQVRAQSDAGEGPWSKLFIGKTLIDDNWSILLGVAGGQILRRNILEDQKKVVVNFFSNSTDIAWFENIAFWVTQEGQLTFYNQTSEEKRQLLKVEKAYSVAYDWLGKKVFWSDLSHVAIYRSDIIGIHVEFIRRSLARDLAIDALRGRLYWATQNSIETSYLNGEHHQELYVIPPFSGPNVISLTLDFDSEKVYWYVKASDSQSLYTTKLIPDNYVGHFPSMAEKVGDFKSISSTSGLQYFSQRLFWLSEKNSLMVGDLHCNFTATISSMTDIKSFVIVPSGLKYKSKPRVIPNPIRSSDIQTEGNSSKFNLTWSNSSEVTHGTVFYRVFIEIGNTNKSFTTSKNKIELSAYSPYIKIGVTIQPYTYWGYADPTTAYLRSPMSKPTAPLSPEVYVIEHKNATASYQTLAADFRWMSPIAINGIISHHFVYHWLGDDESSMTEVKVRGTTRNYILSPLIKNQTYHFKVVACTEAGCGPSSPNKSCVTNELNPVPKLLVGTTKGIGITETDSPYRDFTKLYPTIDEPLKAVSFLHQDDIRLYLINNRNAVVQAHENDLLEIFTLKGNGKDITVDWVSRTLYFVETFSSDKSSITQFNLDNGKYTVFLNRSANVQTIAVDPFNSAVLWLETSVDGEMQILSSDMTNKNVKTVLSSAISNTNKRDGFCNCTLLKNLASVMAVTYSRIDGRIEIFFAENQTGSIYSTDINGCKCIKIFSKSMSNSYGFPPSLIAVDHLRVSWYSQSDRKLYSVNKATGEGLTMQDFTDITDIVALGSNLQPLPDAQCLDPGAASSNVQKYEEGVNYIYLNLTSPIKPSSCLTISSPQTKYTLYYRTVKATKPGAAPEDCQVDLSQCSKLESYSTYMELKGLQPYTQYLIQVAVSNHFYPYLSEALGHPLVITTKFGAPSAALEVVSEPCTPEKIMVTWRPSQVLNGPADQIFYRVQYSTVLTQKETENIKINRTDESYIQTFVNDLTPGTVYTIKVFSCMGNRAQCTSSETVTVKTFLTPYDVFFSNATSYSIVMSWRSPPDNSILRHQIIYAEVTSEPLKWFESGILSVTDNNTQYEELITQLQPNTLYSFKIKASYNYRPFDDAHYIWPSDDSKFTYRTLVFLPNEVSTPDIRKLKSGLFEVKWEKPNDNGAPITNYELELSSADPDHFNWHLVYNGSDTRWLIETKELKPGKHYVFRVAAVNSQGRGAFSQNSSTFIAPHPIAEAGIGQGIIGIIAGTVAVFIAVIFIIIVVLIIQKRKTKTPHFIIRGPDTELATLRELPHTAFQQSNTLYAISIKCTDEEIAKLPHFSRNQLMLTMFLGSGAFGEVFEGLAKNILGDGSGETRCAVKTLRKSASDHEKEEFLKEALLMKNFQHDNILRLLGVCLDNDPQFIIMELMEGGDLLSFLRSCRATSTSPAKLLLPDLVKICVHVVRGCKYLEDMHFVHRDLAARNCLVSSKFPSDMIVKIGDFGLARDIYKNDYYRKEGEGLLPVRWMSPESLVDGFFTTQSDIWAFGVLMWEVLTLGQQPYPARTNIEVLHFVRDGGKLERPEKCTDEMFSLMRKCWSFNCDHRPSFAVLLENLELFQEKCLHMSPEEIIRYSPAVSDVLCMNNQLLPPLPSPAHLYMPPHPSSSSSQPCVENQYFLLEDSNQYSESIELLDSLYFNSQCSIDSQIENFISFERHDNITEILRELSTNENNNLISTAESNVLFASESFNLSYNKQFQVALMSTTKHNRCDRQIYKFSNWKEDENSYNSSKNKTLSVSANAFCNNALDNSLEEQKQNNSVSYLPSLSHIIINPVCSNINKHYDNTRSKGGPGAPMGNINLAFIDEAVNDDANHLMNEEDDLIEEEEEEEKAVMRGLFTPDKPIWGLYTKKVQTITGGGSVRLTQSGKQKRLKDLLSSPDGTEKLVVDLTKIGRKRTQSLEYSTKSSLDSSMDQFPAASNYDHHGYLEPRGTKNGPGYLELMNYAPELRHLRDTQGNPLTLHPSGAPITSVHVTRKGYHPSNINYTLLSPEESSQTGSFSVSGSDMCGEEDSNFQNSQYKDNLGHPYGRTSIDSPIYSRVCDERRLLHSDSSSSSRQFGNSSYYLHPSGQSVDAMLMRSNHQRKFSDQDLYYSTAPYRQRQSSSSSSTHDHRYASVECNNNYSSSNKGHANIAQGFINDNSASSYAYDGKSRHRHGSNNSSNLYAKPGLGFPNNGNVSFTAIEDNSKSNDLDDVFLDNTINSQCSFHPDAEVFSYPQQQNHILRSRGQVYPEHTAAFVGYDSNQVSLV